nr:putative disease resistance RPP13-like protein 1 [Populus alba]
MSVGEKELAKWRRTLQMLQAVLKEAEEKQLTDQTVRMWLHDLTNLAYDVEDILDEFATEALQHKLMVGDEASTRRNEMQDKGDHLSVEWHYDQAVKLGSPKEPPGSIYKFMAKNTEHVRQPVAIYERSRHSSYTRDEYDGIKKFEAFHKAKCSRTFLLFRHDETSYVTKNVVGLLPSLKRLRVLSLSGYNISELPSSIGGLKLLRKIGHGIEELMDLNFLCGTLCIPRLENVVDHRRARQASLPEKQDLESLVLKWSSDITYSRDERIEKDVLDMLQPHQGLQELTINFYSSTQFPSWVGDPSFSNMVLLSLENCENCTSVPALGLLKSLKDFSITGMSGLQSIGREIYGECCSNPFPSLETLYFKDMPGWKYWHAYGEEQVEVFPRLHKLSILNCSQMLMDARNESAEARLSLAHSTPCCPRLVSFGAEEEGQDLKLCLPFSLEMLKFIDCESLERPLVLHGLRFLEELHIENVCWRRERMPTLAEHLFFSTRIPGICPPLKCLSSRGKLPAPLRQLVIWDCPELGSIAEAFCNMSPEQIEIKYCGKFACLPEGPNMLSHLQENTMCNCSSILSFPEGGFPATSLRKLYMGWCEKLKALPERLRSLTSLVELDILTRPSIVSFPQVSQRT